MQNDAPSPKQPIFIPKREQVFIWAMAGVGLLALVALIATPAVREWFVSYSDELTSDDFSRDEFGNPDDCNVAGLNIHGSVVTYGGEAGASAAESQVFETASEDLVFALQRADEDDSIKAVLLDVDSYGGSPVGGQEMAAAVKRFSKPSVALIRQAGASAAYWASSGADVIFASALSDVGGIGVTISYLENAGFNAKEGFVYRQLSTGKYKDTLDPDKPLTKDEQLLIMRDLDIIHEQFVQAVAANRNLSVETVRTLSDGATMLGEAARQHKLIDRIGSYNEVEQYLKELIGEDVEYCW